jgi:DNA (cytosine-5)-methyltransferase 1
MTIGSLFAGIGGFDLGFERAGFSTRWQVEIDAKCREVLARRFPDAQRYEDVCAVHGYDLEPVDVITFGSPCQDLSVAGKRAGFQDGTRSNLFFESTRIMREMREATHGEYPTFALWENVPGALNSAGGRDFAAVLDELADCGALDIGWAVLDAQYFRVAQRRRRVFLVADFRGQRTAEILAFADGLCGDSAPGRTAREGTAGDVAGCLNASGKYDRGDGQHCSFLVAGTVSSKWAKGTGGPSGDECQNLVVPALPASGAGTSRTGNERTEAEMLVCFQQNQRDEVRDLRGVAGALAAEPGAHQQNYVAWLPQRVRIHDAEGVAPTLASEEGRGNGVPTIAFQPRYFTRDNKTGNAESCSSDVIPALRASSGAGDSETHVCHAVSVSLRGREGGVSAELHEGTATALRASQGGSDKGHVLTRMQVRRLTPTECARLQGFPDDWNAWLSDSTRYKQFGNAVCVNVAEWLGHRMKTALEVTR